MEGVGKGEDRIEGRQQRKRNSLLTHNEPVPDSEIGGSAGIVKSRAFFTTIRPKVASHAGIFRGARFSFWGTDEKRAPLKTPAWEARPKGANRREGPSLG